MEDIRMYNQALITFRYVQKRSRKLAKELNSPYNPHTSYLRKNNNIIW